VSVPAVVGRHSASAESAIADAGLRYSVAVVAAPGSAAGIVTKQSPAAPATIPHGSTVALSVAEAPRWRALTTFSGVDDGKSVPFRILGSDVEGELQHGLPRHVPAAGGVPRAERRGGNVQTGSTFGGFELGKGETETHTFTSGPGVYSLVVSGGRDSARWSMTVEDHY